MLVRRLYLKNFRNYSELKIEFYPGKNILEGPNGHGKTNLLEAICMLSVGKSFRVKTDSNLIKIGEKEAFIVADVENIHGNFNIEMRLSRFKNKAVKINGVAIEKISDMFGILNTVVFSPEDLKIIREGPKERRLFVDREISQMRPRYYSFLRDYYKILERRNLLLKTEKPDPDLISVYETQLAKEGKEIMKYRTEFLEDLNIRAAENHALISNDMENLIIKYTPNIKNEDDYTEVLQSVRQEDMFRGYTSRGVHKDDFSILINDVELKNFGSQGQKKSAAASLKLSEIAMILSIDGEYPVVLLDDIFSEFDLTRRNNITEYTGINQTFITSAEKSDIDGKHFYVYNGTIT